MRHSPTQCTVAPSSGNSSNSVCSCGRVWVDTGKSRTSFLGAVLGTEREDDGSRARLLFKPKKARR